MKPPAPQVHGTIGTGPRGAPVPRELVVVYDSRCPLCLRCRDWLSAQPTFLPITFLGSHGPLPPGLPGRLGELAQRLPLGEQLVVVGISADDSWQIWTGSAAFLVCLWATRRYRAWSRRLADGAWRPLALRFFAAVSANRGRLGALAGLHSDLERATCDPSAVRCENG